MEPITEANQAWPEPHPNHKTRPSIIPLIEVNPQIVVQQQSKPRKCCGKTYVITCTVVSVVTLLLFVAFWGWFVIHTKSDKPEFTGNQNLN